MKINGDMNMQENELQNVALATDSSFPSTTKAGLIVFKDKQVYIAAEIDGGNPIWVPLSQKVDYYAHTQSTSSASWVVNHNLNTDDVTVYVYDDATESVIIPNSISITDANNLTVGLGSAISGRVVVMSGRFDDSSIISGFEVLVMNSDSTNGSTTFTDDTGNSTLTGFGNVQHSTATSKFGATSIAFDGTDDFISVSAASNFDLGLANESFTIESWVNFNASGFSAYGIILSKGGGFGGWNGTNGSQFSMFQSESKLYYQWWDGATVQTLQPTFNPTAGTWHHYAATYDGTTFRLFVDGALIGSVGSVTFASPATSNIVRMGSTSAGFVDLNGYIDSIRVEKGYARYTGPFTPPTAPFTV